MGSVSETVEAQEHLDALIVGAGFGEDYQLWRLRNEGIKVKLVDSASDYGGVWHWNRYPGARVDSTAPHYEFSDPNIWSKWLWKQRFPGSAELRDYFQFVAKHWGLRKDTQFNSFVSRATWSETEDKWTVYTKEGYSYKVTYLLLNIGFSARRHIPNWPGIERFRGTWVHPSYWPHKEPDLRGKRVAVVGTGSTGIQLSQELSKVAEEFTLFQRTPNLCLPMKQIEYQGDERPIPQQKYGELFVGRTNSCGGFNFNFLPRNTFDDDPETRRQTYEELWQHGDFHFWLAIYQDMMFSEDANREAYNFWRDKVRARISDPHLREVLAPTVQPHAFGCKRISLENGFYEIFNKPHVKLVDVNTTPIQEVTGSGIGTSDGNEHSFDYVVCATGFDAITRGLKQIDITGENGEKLSDKWSSGTKTYLGMSVAGFPNMLFTYGPQAPTALCNGPTCAELQGDWIVQMMLNMRKAEHSKIVAEERAEDEWAKDIRTFVDASLLPTTKSWYMGDNIPGKPREPLIYLGGVPDYYKTISECAAAGYAGFVRS